MQTDEKVYQNYLVEFAMYYNAFLLQIDYQINYQDEPFGKNLDVVQHAFDMALIEFEMIISVKTPRTDFVHLSGNQPPSTIQYSLQSGQRVCGDLISHMI